MKIQSIQNIFNIQRQSKLQQPFLSYFLSKERLNKDTFEKQNNNISFAGKSCQTSNFEVKFLYDMACPSCDHTMVTSNQLNSFIKNVDHKKGEDLIKILKRYEKYYHPTEKEVADKICRRALEKPELDIAGIVKELGSEHREILVGEQTRILTKLKNQSELLENDEKKEYIAFIDKTVEKEKPLLMI